MISVSAITSTAFYFLLVCVVALPARFAILAWIAMASFDFINSTEAFDPSSSVGALNAIKAFLVPAIIYVKIRASATRSRWQPPMRMRRPIAVWLSLTAFIAYVAIACLWSPYTLASIKFVAHLCNWVETVAVADLAVRARLLDDRCIMTSAWVTLGVGGARNVLLALGMSPDASETGRFTAFVAGQGYGALLLALFCLILFNDAHRRPTAESRLCALLLLVGLLLNGSRTFALGIAIALLWYTFVVVRNQRALQLFVAALTLCASAAIFLVFSGNHTLDDLAGNRIGATLAEYLRQDTTATGVGLGTWRYRMALYSATLQEIRLSPSFYLIFGHGTSTGADVSEQYGLALQAYGRLDRNRALHSEYLRSLYEWGIIGAILLVSLLVTGTHHVMSRLGKRGGSGWASAAFGCAFLIGLASENLLSSAGGPVVMAFALAMTHPSYEGLKRQWTLAPKLAHPVATTSLP